MFPAAPVAQPAMSPVAQQAAKPGGSNKKLLIVLALGLVGGVIAAVMVLKGGGISGGEASSDALIDSALAAMSDGAALEKLIAGDEIQEKAADCDGEKAEKMKDPERIARRKKEMRDELDQAVSKLNVQKLAIDKVELREPRTKDDIKKGEKLGGSCTAKVDVSERKAKIEAHGERDGKPVKVTGKIAMVSVGGRWFLTDAPDLSADGGDTVKPALDLAAKGGGATPARVPPACVEFEKLMTALGACEAMSKEGRDSTMKQLDRMRAAWGKLDPNNATATKATSDACQKGFDAMKPSLAKLGC